MRKYFTFLARLQPYFRQIWKWWLRLLGLGIVVILVIDLVISYIVRDKVYTDIDTLPEREYAVVLGTAKYYSQGMPNLYYKYRIEAAELLLKAQKAKILVLSGDNQTPYYNEPKMMTEDLLKMGVKSEQIQQDYAGYSTLDSILRADQVLKFLGIKQKQNRFFCSEWCFNVIKHSDQGRRFSSNQLGKIFK